MFSATNAIELKQTETKPATFENISDKIKKITDDFEGNGSFHDDMSELREEPVFDEMFNLLQSFLSPYPETQETKRMQTNKNINGTKKDINGTDKVAKYFSTLHQQARGNIKTVNDSTQVNSTSKHPEYVQIWFMMHLPKKHQEIQRQKNLDIDSWIERFFEQFVRSIENTFGEITQTDRANNSEENSDFVSARRVIVQHSDGENLLTEQTTAFANQGSNETNEITADFHVMPETETTIKIAQKQKDYNQLNIWNIKDASEKKRKRSVETKPDNVLTESNNTIKHAVAQPESELLPLIRHYDNFEYNQLRPKRVKRDVQYISVQNTEVPSTNDYSDETERQQSDDSIQINDTQRKNTVVSNTHSRIHSMLSTEHEQKQQPLVITNVENNQQREMKSTAAKHNPLWLAVTLPTVLCKLFLRVL